MPIYDFECERCARIEEMIAGIEEKTQQCICGGEMRRLITTRYNVIGDIEIVTSDITGEPRRITSRKELQQLLREHGSTEKYGKGWV